MKTKTLIIIVAVLLLVAFTLYPNGPVDKFIKARKAKKSATPQEGETKVVPISAAGGSSSSANTVSSTATIKQGSKGNAVKKVQEMINIWYGKPMVTVDGEWGANTQKYAVLVLHRSSFKESELATFLIPEKSNEAKPWTSPNLAGVRAYNAARIGSIGLSTVNSSLGSLLGTIGLSVK